MLIGVDLDDVLADTFSNLIAFHNDNYGPYLTKDKFSSWQLSNVFNITEEEAIKRVLEFDDSCYFEGIKPVDGAVDAVNMLKQSNKLIVITSRLDNLLEKTEKWLEKYFSNTFSKVYHTYHSWMGAANKKKKVEICLDLKVDYFIEDSLDYARECAEKGVKVLLYDNPWNQCKELPENIIRVQNWKEIVSIINNKA